MSFDQIVALVVLVSVIVALIWGRVRSDVVALTGAAALLATGTIRPIEVQGAFASPAIIALASLFVIAYAMELSGLLGALIRLATKMCTVLGSFGLWIVIILCGAASAFLNNTPIVVLSAPVVKDVAQGLNMSPRRFLIPLSYVTILGGACTLIGTSTNLLVNDMARTAGQPGFSIFEVTPVGLILGAVGAIYLFVAGGRLLDKAVDGAEERQGGVHPESSELGDPSLFAGDPPFQLWKSLTAFGVFGVVVVSAGLGYAPIAAAAFSGAVVLILLRVISAEQAYKGLRPDILLLIAAMVVVGLSLEVTGLAALATDAIVGFIRPFGPLAALILLYGVTLLATEILSNAAVAVLLTPIAVALAENLGVSPRPFLVGVMMAGSAAFATPFGYQTNVLVYKMGNYSYMDFVRIGVPLNLITWIAAAFAIPAFFPF